MLETFRLPDWPGERPIMLAQLRREAEVSACHLGWSIHDIARVAEQRQTGAVFSSKPYFTDRRDDCTGATDRAKTCLPPGLGILGTASRAEHSHLSPRDGRSSGAFRMPNCAATDSAAPNCTTRRCRRCL
jgi:hypothetical protein